jgi:hypothetical protein
MNLIQLQDNLEALTQNLLKESFLFDLLTLYGLPKSTVKLLSKNPYKLSGKPDQIILKNKVLFKVTTLEEDEHVAIDKLLKDKSSYKFNPRFIIVTDFETLLAFDTKTKESRDIKIKDISNHYDFFLPWCGMEKSQHKNENPADIRAAYKMDKLYQAIVNDNIEYYKDYSHDLNIFLSRLLFCFFAEDTGIFPENIFTNLIDSQSSADGDELKELFTKLFDVLNTTNFDRSGFANHFLAFPYVNGGLFETKIEIPNFSSISRKLVIENGKLDWSSINPDIFGSMIQAVIHPGQRENLGMHYTSVPNIMKVIEPLFLNDLYEELENSKDNIKKLNNLRERIAKIKIFDPACGSGNFLIISYKELCKLEIQIIKYIYGERAQTLGLDYSMSGITLNNFYGIEIDDFASQIAKLSLYLAQHQINQTFDKEFGKLKPILPLKESGKIVCANATRVDWNEVCPRTDKVAGEHEIYVIGNPPYYGARKQDEDQKEDINRIFKGVKNASNLDYISCWFLLGKNYIPGTKIKLAFVSTNSICQGEQVPVLWPLILKDQIEINFAYQSFKWKNSAKGNAGVTCIIVGLRSESKNPRYIFSNQIKVLAKNISPYLVDSDNLFVQKRSKPLSNLPEMSFGSMANDDGNFLLSKEEKDSLVQKDPKALKFIKKAVGGIEFINGVEKYCIWINDEDYNEAVQIPEILNRINKVKSSRLRSSREATQKLANKPYKFGEVRHKDIPKIVLPATSSEKRIYIPIGFLEKDTVVTNATNAIHTRENWIFAVLNSRMHITWVRAVGGRLKTDLRYSSALCYNTFPFPDITHKQKESLTTHVYNILEEREKYPEKTMADLYDPDKMPSGLQEAHKYLDQAIDQIYRNKPFESDEDRLAYLFKLYEEMITREIKE